MGKQKHWHDVRGWQIDCPDYRMCPLCYGCRSYDSSRLRCIKCAEDMKRNVCNTQMHREDLLARMIPRQVIEIK